MIRLTTLARLRGLGNRAARPQLRRISDGNAGNTSYATGEEKRRKKVAVAMSGGVDSAACAYLLQKEGYDCVGVFMRNWDSSDEEGGNSACTLSQDLKDMQQVCARLGIPTVEVDFMKEYWHDVFVPFLEAYQSGKETPNPDVYCNRHIKFDQLRTFAFEQLQADFLATGHYAQLRHTLTHTDASKGESEIINGGEGKAVINTIPALLRGVDPNKDQTYFLSMTPGANFRNVLFPLGGMAKDDVRRIVDEPLKGCRVLSKAESMGVCFIGKRKFSDFLGQYLSLTPGRFLCADTGDVLGQHTGREVLTVGQGAKIGGVSEKYFVVSPANVRPELLPKASEREEREEGGLGEGVKEEKEEEGGDLKADPVRRVGTLEQRIPNSHISFSPLDSPRSLSGSGDVWVGKGSLHPALFSQRMRVSCDAFSWISGAEPVGVLGRERDGGTSGTGGGLRVKLRYRQDPVACTVEREREANGPGDVYVVHFERPQRAVTTGQVAALYQGEVCLGGGTILG